MPFLRLAALLPLLAACAPAEEPGLTAATLEAEDACAPGSSEEECQISFRQLRGVARHVAGRSQQGPLALGSSVTEGIDYKRRTSYSSSEFQPGTKLINSFTENKDGAKWEFDSAIISLDAQPQMFETIDEKKPMGLRIELTSTLAGLLNAKVTLRIARLDEFVSGTLVGSRPKADQMNFFRMAAPACFGKEHCYARQPEGGFAAPPKAVKGLAVRDVVAFNLTGFLDANHTSVHVYVVPDVVSLEGLWETAPYKLQNWRFFNLADNFDDPADSSGSSDFDSDSGGTDSDSGGSDSEAGGSDSDAGGSDDDDDMDGW